MHRRTTLIILAVAVSLCVTVVPALALNPPPPAETVTMTPTPNPVAPGGRITLKWTAPAGHTNPLDWIGLFAVGAPNTSFGPWRYTNGATAGTMTFTAPRTAGLYEFRYLLDDGYQSVTPTAPLTVSLATTTTTSTTTTTTTRPTTTTTTTTPLPPPNRVLSGRVSLAGFEVPAGQRWVLDPNVSTTVEVSANVVVRGLLEMRPASPAVVHTLRFVRVDESRFVGGGMEPLASDVGLWVMGDGRLDVQGSPKVAWNRTGTDPSWLSGDEVVVAPTEVGDFSGFRPFVPGSSVPQVVANERTYRAEVLNLTRNVVIEGSPPAFEIPEAGQVNNPGRAHIFIRSTKPQTIKYATLRHLGPRQYDSALGASRGVLGRYPLHFHHSFEGSRGSVIEGVVARDVGNHAFATHASHGVTHRNTIAYNVVDDAYWWDPPTFDETGNFVTNTHASNDTLFDGAVAALVKADFADFGTFARVAGFTLMAGTGNTIRNSVAVGVQGAVDSSGFQWPEGVPNFVWTFTDNLAHNNVAHGIFWWQVDVAPHLVDRFDSYRNGISAIHHGAYLNNAHYRNVRSYQDGERASLLLQAGPHEQPPGLVFEDMTLDAGGVSPAAVEIGDHVLMPPGPARLARFTVKGWTQKPVIVNDLGAEVNANDGPVLVDLVCWSVGSTGRDLEAADIRVDSMSANSVIRVQRKDGKAFQLAGPGTVPKTISQFAAC